MKLLAPKKPLALALALAAKFVKKDASQPLSLLDLEARDGALRVTARSESCLATFRLGDGVEVLESGAVAVDARGLADRVAVMQGEQVRLAYERDRFSLRVDSPGHKRGFLMHALASSECPVHPRQEPAPDADYVEVAASKLISLLSRGAYATDPGSYLDYKLVAGLRVSPGSVVAESTDGSRLARTSDSLEAGRADRYDLPHPALRLVRALCAETAKGADVALALAGGSVRLGLVVGCGVAVDLVVATVALPTAYPDLDMAIPKGAPAARTARVDRAALLEALGAVFAPHVHLGFTTDELVVAASSIDGAEDEARLPISAPKLKAATVHLNKSFLRDALESFDDEFELELVLPNEKLSEGLVVRGVANRERQVSVIMPMRA